MTARSDAFVRALDDDDEASAIDLAASLDEADRSAIAEGVRDWLERNVGLRRSELFPYVAEDAWPGLTGSAIRLARGDEDERDRAAKIIDTASRMAPDALRPRIDALDGSAIKKWRLDSWRESLATSRERVLHIVLPRDIAPLQFPHPTRGPTPPDAPTVRFGGLASATCGLCAKPLHHLVTLESPRRLEIATCMSCLGWEQDHGDYTLRFRHDASGAASPMDHVAEPHEPEFPTEPLLEGRATLFDAGPRFAVQDWGAATRGENLHRIGGAPTWVQHAEIRSCPSCTRPMRSLLQLDSHLPQANGQTFLWGSGGVLYVEFCDACAISEMFWQCT